MSATVREAAPDELPAVLNVLDAAMLATDAESVRRAAGRGDVLVATDEGRVLGALVLAGIDGTDHDDADYGDDATDADAARIDAIAVRRARRGQGIGATLVEAAGERVGTLSAEFDADAHPFYESLGFAVEPAEEGRFVGRLDT